MRPIACESEEIMLIAPISCNMSSAAIVSALILDSAKATSSGMFLSRWWQTICLCFHTRSLTRKKSSDSTLYSPIQFSYQHVKMFIYSIFRIWPCWVGWWRDYIFYTTNFDDIWCMSTTSTFAVQKDLTNKNSTFSICFKYRQWPYFDIVVT